MRIIKNIVLVILGIAILFTVVGFLLPSEAFMKRSINIGASKEAVFREVNALGRFNEWSNWYQADPEATYIFSGPESGVGSEISWDGEVVGQGRMFIVRTVAPDSVLISLYFDEGTKPYRADFYLSEAGPDSVELTWIFQGKLSLNPIERYMGLMTDSFIGPDYEAGLQALKNLIETKSSPAPVRIDTHDLSSPHSLIGIRGRYRTPEEARAAMTASFQSVDAFIADQGIENPAYGSVYFIDVERGEAAPVEYIAGIFSTEDLSLPPEFIREGFVGHDIPSGLYLRAVHMGKHETLPQTHTALMTEMETRNYVLQGDVWEMYPVHGGTEPDTAQWETHIYYPVHDAESN